jgi:ribonuclease D
MLVAVSAGLAIAESDLPFPPVAPREDPDAALIADLMNVLLRRRARDSEIAPSLLGNRHAIESLVTWLGGSRKEPAPPILIGWRRKLVGADLEALWDGKTALVVEQNPHTVSTRPWDPEAE